MNSIERRGANQFESLVECKTFLDVIAQTLQVAEGCVTFVAVIDILLDTEFLQQQNTTDTEQNLLLQTVLPVTTIEAVGDRLVKIRVHLVISIQQVEFYATYIDTPYTGMNLIVGVRNINHHRIAVLVELALNRQRTEVLALVVGNLLTIDRQTLCEVTKTIEETHCTHIDIGIGSLLHIVTCQHSQTAGINLQG